MNKRFVRVILCAFLISSQVSAAHALTLGFTEIMYDLDGTDDKREWVEIHNDGPEPITIQTGSGAGSWRFSDGLNHTLTVVQGEPTLASSTGAIITSDAATWLAEHSGFTGTVFDTTMSLRNTSSTIALMDPSGIVVDMVQYDASWGGNGNGKTLERASPFSEAGTWVESTIIGGTPGVWDMTSSTTSTSTTATTTTDGQDEPPAPVQPEEPRIFVIERTVEQVYHFRISELLPNPKGVDTNAEWIEVFNGSSSPIDLEGWRLEDASGKSWVVSEDGLGSTVISANGFLMVPRTASHITLDNSKGDQVKLFSPSGKLVDAVAYTEVAPEDSSYALIDGQWQWTTTPSPAATNVKTVPVMPDDDTVQSVRAEVQTVPIVIPNIALVALMPNPVGKDTHEYVVVENRSTSTVDLVGWKIDDEDGGSKPYAVASTTPITAGGSMTFDRDVTKLSLGNAKDEVRLIAPNGIVVSTVAYHDAPEGIRYIYEPFDAEWMWGQATSTNDLQKDRPTVLGTATSTEEGISSVQGTVILPPGIVSKRRIFITDENGESDGQIREVYVKSGAVPSLKYGERIAIGLSGSVPDGRVDIGPKNVLSRKGNGKVPEPRPVSLDTIGEDDVMTYVAVSGRVIRKNTKSFVIGEGEESIMIVTDPVALAGLKKDALVHASGILLPYGNAYRFYPSHSTAVTIVPEVASTEAIASSTTATSSATSFPVTEPEQPWFYLLSVPGVAGIWWVVKRYLLQ